MSTLLVPVDFSDVTASVVDAAKDLALDLNASLVLLHVAEPVSSYVPVGASMDVIAPLPSEIEAIDAAEHEHRLKEVAESWRVDGLKVEAKAVVGLAVDEIISQAEIQGARYIVMGSHGHGALYHLFSGSVVTGVLKKATCPVLIVPAPKNLRPVAKDQ